MSPLRLTILIPYRLRDGKKVQCASVASAAQAKRLRGELQN
jgi:hypothetical protein